MKKLREITRLHKEAMEFATKAELCKKTDQPLAHLFFTKAFELEKEAALLIGFQREQEPSRSILCRSAASLALDCIETSHDQGNDSGFYDEAERLVHLGLAGIPPSEILADLRELGDQIDLHRHLSLKGLKLDETEIQLAIAGPSANSAMADVNEVMSRVDALQRIFRRIQGYLDDRPIEAKDAPEKSHPVFMSLPRAGSYTLTMKIGRPFRQTVFPFMQTEVEPTIVVNKTVDCLQLYVENKFEELRLSILDNDYLDVFTHLSKKLAPDGKLVKSVGLTTYNSSKKKQKAVSLPMRSQLKRIRPTVNETPVAPTILPEKNLSGRLMFADDIKEHSFRLELANGSKSESILVSPGTLADLVKPHWGDEVTVAVEERNGKLYYLDIKKQGESE